MLNQGGIDKLSEMLLVVGQHLGSLLEAQSLGAVAAVVGHMAAGLVGEQLDFNIVIHGILEKIHNISVVGDGDGLLPCHIVGGQPVGLLGAVRNQAHPALAVPCLDP